MQIRQISGLLLGIFDDEILRVSYAKILTNDKVESVRLPTNVDNYKYKHLLQPNYKLELELIKTRKNWILKSILGYKELYKPNCWDEHLKYCQVITKIKENLIEEQETTTLGFLEKHLENMNCIDINSFNLAFAKVLGH
jgi:hypothetical protein